MKKGLEMQLELSVSTMVAVDGTIKLCGGATESIFPRAEALIQEGDYALAVREVIGVAREEVDSGYYCSLMDFFFCTLFPGWQQPCFEFYGGKGLPLRSRIRMRRFRQRYEQVLLKALEVVLRAHQEPRKMSLEDLRREAGTDRILAT